MTITIEASPIDLESPDLTEYQIGLIVGPYLINFHEEIRRAIDKCLASPHGDYVWRVTSIEERSESLYAPSLVTSTWGSPLYDLSKTLATFDIVATENGPVARIEDGERFVAIARRKLRLKAELAGDGTLKIVESEVDAPKRRYL
jgi:hypothetical protein